MDTLSSNSSDGNQDLNNARRLSLTSLGRHSPPRRRVPGGAPPVPGSSKARADTTVLENNGPFFLSMESVPRHSLGNVTAQSETSIATAQRDYSVASRTDSVSFGFSAGVFETQP